MRKYCFSNREKLLKFEVEKREFAKIFRSLEKFTLDYLIKAQFVTQIEQKF